MTNQFTYLWRLSPAVWRDDETFSRLAAVFDRQPAAVDELAFFLSEPTDTAYFPMDRFEADLAVYQRRAEYFRARGKKVGINVWPTFGEPAKPACPDTPVIPADFDMAVGMDGSVDPAVVCPLSPGFLRHITQRYRKMAATHPDFIWVDDDTRFTHIAQVPYPCFCDRCVRGFEDGRWTRETLVAALNAPENQALRVRWSDYGGERLAMFCRELRRAVDEIDPSIDLPFMSAGQTHTTYSGNFLTRCMEELRSRRGRPGHGFYYDDAPEGQFWKAMEVGRQVKQYPACTQSAIWEEESHPCMFLAKSATSRLHETLLMLLMGGDGIAFNHLSGSSAPGELSFREYERELARCAQAKPVLEDFLRFAVDLPTPGGVWPLDSIHMMAAMDCTDGWFREGGFGYSSDAPYGIDKAEALNKCGIPTTPFDKTSCAVALTGRTMDCLSDGELRALFEGNVLLDGEALIRLAERGMAELAGVAPGERHVSTKEVFTAHPLNGPFARANRMALDSGFALRPLSEKTEVLCELKDAYGRGYGPCVTLYENGRGGKVVVFGYQPWKHLGQPAKLWQLKEIGKRMGLPGWIEYPEPYAVGKLVPFIRTDGKRAACAVFNAFLDDAPGFEVWLPGEMVKAELMDLDGNRGQARVRREDGALVVQLPMLRAWREVMILAE